MGENRFDRRESLDPKQEAAEYREQLRGIIEQLDLLAQKRAELEVSGVSWKVYEERALSLAREGTRLEEEKENLERRIDECGADAK